MPYTLARILLELSLQVANRPWSEKTVMHQVKASNMTAFHYVKWKVFRIGTVHYHWRMSAHASQAFSIASCTDSEDLPVKLHYKGNENNIRSPIRLHLSYSVISHTAPTGPFSESLWPVRTVRGLYGPYLLTCLHVTY